VSVTQSEICAPTLQAQWNIRCRSGRVMSEVNEMILSGWKEIAHYLGRGVRTVQRWEQLGLPVRRPHSHLGSPVVVSSEEIDAWLSRCSSAREPAQPIAANSLGHSLLASRRRQRLVPQPIRS
jgi:hypothetical protein